MQIVFQRESPKESVQLSIVWFNSDIFEPWIKCPVGTLNFQYNHSYKLLNDFRSTITCNKILSFNFTHIKTSA